MIIQNKGKCCLALSIALTIITDMIVKPIIYSQGSISEVIISDVLILSITGWVGLVIANKEGIPAFLPKKPIRDFPAEKLIGYALAGTALIVLNTITWKIYSESTAILPNWVNRMSPATALLISIRASLVEEIVYRLFAISAASFLLRHIGVSERYGKLISVMVSSILFSLIFHGGSVISVLSGILLGLIFLEFGLICAIFTHFAADAIPFIIISIH